MTKVKQIGFVVLAITLLLGSCSKKKNNSPWVINEVLVNNKTNMIDEYGERNGWIEIYNNTAKTQDLGGMYLTTDKNNPKMYPIPLGDVRTQIKPYQHALFWADDKPFHGNFHTNFKLDTIGENYIALYEADGKTLVDEIVVPAGIPADKTFGYPVDGIKYDEEGNLTATILERVTPGSNNKIIAENPKIIDLKQNDPWGINTGRLGFLTGVNYHELDDILPEIVEKKYRIEERTLLEIDTKEDPNPFDNVCALNEVAILKQDTASMLSIHAYINGEYLTSYQADGLVIATPTGSTAYSLSIGGPILVPTSPSFILAAIAPHSLTARPLVVGDDSRILLKVESRSKHYLVSLDGHSQIFDEHTSIEVYKAAYTQKIVKRIDHTFFKTLRDKLMWGTDLRK